VAELRPERPLRLFTNLQLRVQGPDGDGAAAETSYAKVAGLPSAEQAVPDPLHDTPRIVRRYLEEYAAEDEKPR
jgi:hypothetical protein